MRTPNCECVICSKPLYRRPSELARVRHVACMVHRGEAQRREGQTEAQKAALLIGQKQKGNGRTGYKHTDNTKAKISASHKKYCQENPARIVQRGKKIRGSNHYKWKGGANKLNTSIRRMTENRRWMDAVKDRDGACLRCGGSENLETHHLTSLATLIEVLGITSREDAREHAEALWDLDNGEALCERCHYEEHGRTYVKPKLAVI